MQKINICTVVTGNTLSEFLEHLDKIQQLSDLVELRVDYIANLKPEDIMAIRARVTKPCIFTCRRQAADGRYTGTDQSRLEIIYTACANGFPYVDVELSSVTNFDMTRKAGAKLLLSFHDFKGTPSMYHFTELLMQMRAYHPDMLKFATTVNTDEDIKTLYSLVLNKKLDEKLIVVGMGEKGRITRVIAPLLGSYLTYAATELSQSAPGQLPLSELKSIYEKLAGY